jgi:hypothetical protein
MMMLEAPSAIARRKALSVTAGKVGYYSYQFLDFYKKLLYP